MASRVRTIRLLVGAALVCMPFLAHALGLGRLVVHSGLDEPLNGEIEVFTVTPQELKTLRASLAPRTEFDAAGIERMPHLATIKYTVSSRPDGRHYVLLATDQPLREPFLHFLLQAEWAGGRIIREYTALLDPPHWVAGKPADIEAPKPGAARPMQEPVEPQAVVSPTPAPVEAPSALPVPPPTERPITAQAPLFGESLLGPPHVGAGEMAEEPAPFVYDEKARAESAAQAGVDWATVAEYGPVKQGETLGQIADKVRLNKSLSTEQVVLALLKANPQAFYGNNANNLRVGKILKIPQREAVEAVSRPQAVKELHAQHNSWQEYKLKLAGASRAPVVAPAEAPVAPKAAVKKEDKAAPSKDKAVRKDTADSAQEAPADDLLKIVRATLDEKVKPEGSGVSGAPAKPEPAGEQRQLRDKVATMEEALESKQMENKELRERVAMLQQQVENTKRLIEVQNRELALSQKQATESKADQAGAKPAEPPKARAGEATVSPPPAPAVTPGPKKPAAEPPAPPEAGTGMFEGVLEDILANPVTLGLLGVVVALGGIVLIFYVRRRGHAKSEFAESILSGGTMGGTATAAILGRKHAAGDASFLSDFSKGGMGNIHHTDEVDPVAEAEVYLAYGRDEQAEEILKEAVVKDPARHELKLKLLEIYHQRNDLAAFETLAEELYVAIEGKGGKIWDRVEEMGRKMNPNNPMFRGGRPGAPSVPAAPKPEPTAAVGLAVAPPLAFETAAPAKAAMPASEIHFDLGPETPPAAPPEGAEMEFSIAEAGASPEAAMIDFESPFKAEAAAAPASARAAIADEPAWATKGPGADLGVSFETATAGAAPQAAAEIKSPPDWDETATKLDLAKAYIDMGDAEGARSILDEVMAEGTDLQKKQARELAAQIS